MYKMLFKRCKQFKSVRVFDRICYAVVVSLLLGFSNVISLTPSPDIISDDSSSTSTITFAHEKCQIETLSGPEFNKFYSTDPLTNVFGTVEILVRLKGASDGHIALTEGLHAHAEEQMYMIVLGSHSNMVSEIRRSKSGATVFKMNTPGILSEIQFRGFLIRYNQRKGELWVYSEGSDMPLLHWFDPDPLYIQYFSFSAFDDKVVKAAFNCKPTDVHSIIPSLLPGSTPNPKRRSKLLTGYDTLALPNYRVDRDTELSLVTVNLPSLTLTHFSIDEERQTFELEAWPYFTWQDNRLVWEPEANEPGDGKIHFSPDEIWLPDIALYNSARPTKLDIYGKTQCLVTRDGSVTWVPPSKFIVYCDLDLRRWPRDTQTCSVKLGSWTHDASEIDMQFGTIEAGELEKVKVLEDFKKEDMEWNLLDSKAVRESKQYDCCSENYTSITYEFTIQRRSTLYTFTIFVPVVLISFINLILFLQPAESTGRVTVASLNFLVVSTFLIFFRSRLPEVDHVPYIVILYGWNLILLALSILTAALVSNINRIIGSSRPPQMLQCLYNPSLMSVLCLAHLRRRDTGRKEQASGSGKNVYKKHTGEDIESNKDAGSGSEGRDLLPLTEWALLAATVDRLSFVAYTTITLILLACLA